MAVENPLAQNGSNLIGDADSVNLGAFHAMTRRKGWVWDRSHPAPVLVSKSSVEQLSNTDWMRFVFAWGNAIENDRLDQSCSYRSDCPPNQSGSGMGTHNRPLVLEVSVSAVCIVIAGVRCIELR
jgi:hypothetical protein